MRQWLSIFLSGMLVFTGVVSAQRIDNGDFSKGLEGWKVTTDQGAVATSEVVADAFDGKPALKIEIKQVEDEKIWMARFSKADIALEAGVSYTLKFSAKVEPTPKSIEVSVAADRKTVIERHKFALTPEWQEFEMNFVPSAAAADAALGWSNLARTGSTFYFADVRLVKE